MSNETKRDVFEKVLNEWDDLVHKCGLQGEEAYGYCEFDLTISKYEKNYDAALNGILWVDDNLIISLEAKKFYTEQPHLMVEVKEWLE